MNSNLSNFVLTELYKARLNLLDEKVTQLQIAGILSSNHIQYVREFKINEESTIDFLLSNDIGMEVKLKGTSKNIYRQIERYCRTGKFKSLILVTNKSMGLPVELHGVNLYYIHLGKAWL